MPRRSVLGFLISGTLRYSNVILKVTAKWKDLFPANNQWTVVDIPAWMSRATLDALGEGATIGLFSSTPFYDKYSRLRLSFRVDGKRQ